MKFKTGKYLRQRRLVLEISQAEMARQLGVTSQFISRIEKGISNPPSVYIKKIASILGIHIEEIVRMMVHDYEDHLKKQSKKG